MEKERARKKRDSNIASIISEYPLETFPNWTIAPERYYVEAPVDRWGDWAFHARSHITSLILAGNPAIEFLQRFECPLLDKAAFAFSFCGLEEVFFLIIATSIWCLDAKLGRLLSILLAAGFFISSSMKVFLALPRPPAPPAKRISEEDRDWAFPSNHAIMGTAFPWFIWMYASAHYELSFLQSLLLLTTVLTWNSGVIWSRVYLGVHSPCDVVGGWMTGVMLLFVFSGFADHIHSFYVASSLHSPFSLLHLGFVCLLALYLHPRAWPETQSFSEVMCVLPGALIGIWMSRIFLLGGNTPPASLSEISPEAPLHFHLLRIFTGSVVVAVVRVVVKILTRFIVLGLYSVLGLSHYSYSAQCKRLGAWLPTKRYTTRLRFRPIPGEKRVNWEQVPYDSDLPIKFVVYSCVGFLVSEGCPYLFSRIGI